MRPVKPRATPAAALRHEAVERLSATFERAGLRVGMSVRAVLGLLLVVVLVVCVLGFRVLRAEQRAAPRPIPTAGLSTSDVGTGPGAVAATGVGRPLGSVTAPASPTGGGATGVATGSAGSPTAAAPSLIVHVVGQVRRPGVVRLAPGARVQQAVAAAGGALPGAGLAGVNMARPVLDGEQVVVPRPGEAPSPVAGPPASTLGGGDIGSGGSLGAGPSAGRIVDLNTAQLSDLDALPGVGPVLAQRIVDWRTANGRFTSVDELGEVSGIGDTVLGRLRPLVRV